MVKIMADTPSYQRLTREQLEAHWMPYTGNRQFKEDPRIMVGAEGAWYLDDRGIPFLWPFPFTRFTREMEKPRFEDYALG